MGAYRRIRDWPPTVGYVCIPSDEVESDTRVFERLKVHLLGNHGTVRWQ
jgi:hypothetical protein